MFWPIVLVVVVTTMSASRASGFTGCQIIADDEYPDRRSDLMDDYPERGQYPAAVVSRSMRAKRVAGDGGGGDGADAGRALANRATGPHEPLRAHLHCEDHLRPHQPLYVDPILAELGGGPSWHKRRRESDGGASAVDRTVVGSDANGRRIRAVSAAEDDVDDEKTPAAENVIARRPKSDHRRR